MLADSPAAAQNPARAAAFLKRGCDIGSAEACVRLGAAHRDGSLGQQQNALLAAGLFEKACQKESPDGCLALAGIYASPGALESQEQAAELYQRACGWRVAEACREIALRYESGTGVPQDAQRARSLHHIACDLGSQASCGQP
jgi:TPR repeat protein